MLVGLIASSTQQSPELSYMFSTKKNKKQIQVSHIYIDPNNGRRSSQFLSMLQPSRAVCDPDVPMGILNLLMEVGCLNL